MTRVLVVEDSLTQAVFLQSLLTSAGYTVDRTANGKEALASMERALPDVVVSDLRMPEMGGIELVEAVRRKYPAIPVVLTTGMGSEESAVEALQKGAASYVPKHKLDSDILPTLKNVLAIAAAQKQRQVLHDFQASCEAQFELSTDPGLVTPLVSQIDEMLARMRFCDEAVRIRMGIAVHEAMVNAIVHGNLEVGSHSREGDGRAYSALIQERLRLDPYCHRKVYVSAHVNRNEARFVIRDEGPGFDPQLLPDPTDPTNVERVHGRGMFLIRTFLDEVSHNAGGNEITMIKRRELPPSA